MLATYSKSNSAKKLRTLKGMVSMDYLGYALLFPAILMVIGLLFGLLSKQGSEFKVWAAEMILGALIGMGAGWYASLSGNLDELFTKPRWPLVILQLAVVLFALVISYRIPQPEAQTSAPAERKALKRILLLTRLIEALLWAWLSLTIVAFYGAVLFSLR